MVTEYDPESVTVIDGVVAPFDQRFPVGDDEVKMTLPPAQKVVAPEAVIVGVARSDGKANCFAGIGRRVVDVNLDRGYLRCAPVNPKWCSLHNKKQIGFNGIMWVYLRYAPVNPFGVASTTKSKSVCNRFLFCFPSVYKSGAFDTSVKQKSRN